MCSQGNCWKAVPQPLSREQSRAGQWGLLRAISATWQGCTGAWSLPSSTAAASSPAAGLLRHLGGTRSLPSGTDWAKEWGNDQPTPRQASSPLLCWYSNILLPFQVASDWVCHLQPAPGAWACRPSMRGPFCCWPPLKRTWMLPLPVAGQTPSRVWQVQGLRSTGWTLACLAQASPCELIRQLGHDLEGTAAHGPELLGRLGPQYCFQGGGGNFEPIRARQEGGGARLGRGWWQQG